jgi:hypothetical protein
MGKVYIDQTYSKTIFDRVGRVVIDRVEALLPSQRQ